MILVTGATGHIGNVLIRKLLGRGEKIRAMIMPGDDAASLEGLEIERVEGDIRNSDDVMKSLDGIDVVYHLAAIISIRPEMKKLIYDVNVGGVQNVLNAAKSLKTKRIVYTGSVHAFAEPPPGSVIDETTPFDPGRTSGIYGKSKATAVLKAIEEARNGLDVVVVCPSGVIGPYDYKLSEMGRMILSFIRGKLKIGIKGEFDFVDVRDVAEGEILACNSGKRGEVYILGGEKISIERFFEIMSDVMNFKNRIVSLGKYSSRFVSAVTSVYSVIFRQKPIFTPYTVHTLTRGYTFSHKKAAKNLGYLPRPIERSIAETLEWFVKNFGP